MSYTGETAKWALEPVPGGVKLIHQECGQYRSFDDTERVGLVSFVMGGHVCPREVSSEHSG